MIGLLIFALVVLLVCAVLIWIVRMFPLPQPFLNIACAIVALIGLLVVISRIYPGLMHD